MNKFTTTAFLLAFSLLLPQQAQADTPIKVSAILVKTNDAKTICNGGLFVANIDLSQPRDKMYDCGIKTLVNKKINGSLQLQVLNNQTWEDFDQSSHWFPTSKGYFDSQNKHTHSYPIKLTSHHYGEISKGTKITYLNKKTAVLSNSIEDWRRGPLPYVEEYVVGGDSYITSISEIKLRVKVISGSNSFFSNPVTYFYSNHTYFTIALDKYGHKALVPRSPNSAVGTNSTPRPETQTPELASSGPRPRTSSLPLCTGSQEASLINLLSQANANSRVIGIYRTRLDKVKNDLGDAYARNAMLDYEKLLIDKKSIESELDNSYKQRDKLRQAEEIILTTCIRQDQDTDYVVPNNQKILPCTAGEVKRLLILIAQYSTKQELIRITKSNIEKAKIDLNYAVSAGKNPGNFQAVIQRYNTMLQSDLGVASSIKKEFNTLNGGCSNSQLSLP
jgi:hypothetical protein